MSTNKLTRAAVLVALIGSFLATSGCADNKASLTRLSGDTAHVDHERHATGIESHVGDI